MNPILLIKEFYSLRLTFFICLGLTVFYTGYIFITDFPDMQTEPENSGAMETVILFGMLIGARALSQEREEETQSFLDGLPISRSAIFWHKALAAWLVFASCLVVEVVGELILQMPSQTSVSEVTQWSLYPLEFSLVMLFGIMVIGLSMLASFVRGHFPLIAGLVIWSFIWLRSQGGDLAAWLNSQLFFEDAAEVTMKTLLGHGGIAIIALLLSWLFFQWRDGRVSIQLAHFADSRYYSWLGWPLRCCALVVWVFALKDVSNEDKNKSHDAPEIIAAGEKKAATSKASFVGFANHRTDNYEVVFRQSQREKMHPLFSGMDQVHEQVAMFFQHPPSRDAPIVLDVASIVARHAGGQTNWKKIRLPLNKDVSRDEFYSILRHETGHVFIEELSQGAATAYFQHMRAFHEGVATTVQLSDLGKYSTEQRLKYERTAALADERGRISIELLCDNDALCEKRDPNVVYPLGLIFADALLEVGGPELPKNVLTNLRQNPPAPGADTATLWRHVLQASGTSLDHILSAYATRLKALKEREKSFIGKHPIIKSDMREEAVHLIIRPKRPDETPIDSRIICAIENDLGLATELQYIFPEKDGSFRIPLAAKQGGKLRYMIGWSSPLLALPVFESWAEW